MVYFQNKGLYVHPGIFLMKIASFLFFLVISNLVKEWAKEVAFIMRVIYPAEVYHVMVHDVHQI